MTQIPIAHTGHVLVDLLYVLPLVIAVGVLATQSWRDKRQEKAKRRVDAPPAG